MSKGIKRRDFFKAAAVTGAAATMASCTSDPVEDIIPMLVPPDDYLPGVTIKFATVCQECSSQCGTIVRTREGRAIKIEGNPNHPLNQGSLCAVGQASVQGHYHPNRVKTPAHNGGAVSWDQGIQTLASQVKGKGNRVLYIGRPLSGTFQDLLDKWLTGIGGGRKLLFDMNPVNSIKKANEMTFGRGEIPHYALDKAKFLLNFGADFMETWLNPLELTKDYTTMHSFKNGEKGRFVHVSPHMSLTGSNADEWVTCKVGEETLIALGMVNALLNKSNQISASEKDQIAQYVKDYTPGQVAAKAGISAEKIQKLADAFYQNGSSVALAGGNTATGTAATDLQIAVNLLNYVAGNVGNTVVFGADYQYNASSMNEVEQAVRAMNSGEIDVVIIHNANPVYALPKNSGFQEALSKVGSVVSLSTTEDETTRFAKLHLPTSSSLESWGDSRPRNGVYGLQQPAMAKLPMFKTMEAGDLFLSLGQNLGLDGFGASSFQEYLKTAWQAVHQQFASGENFDSFWKKSLQAGGVFKNFTATSVSLNLAVLQTAPVISTIAGSGLTLLAVNSTFHSANGYGGDKPWLLEVPHPLTQIVWDSWIEIHPETAVKHRISHGDLVEVSNGQGSFKTAAWLYHGVERNTVAIPAGLGREVPFPSYNTSHGKSFRFIRPTFSNNNPVKTNITAGESAATLLSFAKDQKSGDFAFASNTVTIKPTGEKAFMVNLDGQNRDDIEALTSDTIGGVGDRSQKDRGFVQEMTVEEAKHGGGHSGGHHLKHRHYEIKKGNEGKTSEENTSFYERFPESAENYDNYVGLPVGNKSPQKYYETYKWEMSIDLDRCNGCSACVVACYAENNVPVVGKERQAVGREMSWIRIERYFEKNKKTGDLETRYAPETCNQCENAGCEPVCPVYATYHTPEGTNAQVYNRCVGTRYCANNCVYEQRRFNWRTYVYPSPLNFQLNPAVSAREKGVMEKCTFCVQRVREAKELVTDQGRQLHAGELKTACQETCPTQAITFGNIKQKDDPISQQKTSNRAYKQLEELNFKPSITYLKKVVHDKEV